MARTTRGQGQWALGYREPLNPNERSKRDNDPLTVRERIEKIYAPGGFDSIDPADLRGRFRWYGLYTQRAAAFRAARPRCWSPRSWTRATSCCAYAPTAAR